MTFDQTKALPEDYKKSYQKLDEMREIIAAANMGIWSIYLLEGRAPAMEADDRMKELLGINGRELTPEEVYEAWFSNVTPGAVENVLQCVENMKAGKRDEVTYLWKHPLLGERYVRCGGTSKRVKDGYILRGYHYDVDAGIREKKRKDEALEQQLAIIDTLSKSFRNVFVANMADGTAKVIRLADNYKVAAIRDVEGRSFPFDAVVKRWIQENVHPDDKKRVEETINIEHIKKLFNGQDAVVGTYRSVEDGVIHTYQYDFRRIGDTEQVVAGFQIIDAIIEEHRAQERKQREMEEVYQKELISAKEEADRANASKTEFLLRMSHDIRTPINGIMGMLEMEEKYADDTKKLAECRKKIRDASGILLDLINEVLDMSKLESGEIVLEHIPFDLVGISTEVYYAVKKQADDRNIEILQEDCSACNARLIGSPVHIKRLMMNIVGNAIKYNKDCGKVYITCREIKKDGDRIDLQFQCRDTGIGMSPEFLKRVFEPFTQENPSSGTKYAGTGLGLSIAKNLVDKMGGTITVESKKGAGTVFDVHIPLDIDRTVSKEEVAAEETESVSIEGLRILLVEDNELNMEIARFLLEEEGAEITEAWNGREAVERFESASPGEYDVILMDVMMPVMNGYEATKAIRSLKKPGAKTIPIIAMTANAFAEDKIEAMNSGMNEHIAKPLDKKNMIRTIARVVQE